VAGYRFGLPETGFTKVIFVEKGFQTLPSACIIEVRKDVGINPTDSLWVGFEILCKRFNHSSPVITMRYFGIEDKEVQSILMNEVG